MDAVVVSYQAAGHLGACVRSLLDDGARRVVVVDNGSTDGSEEVARAAGAGWVASGANVGYGRAANLGAATSDAPWLLVANPDLVVRPGALAALRGRLEAEADLALAGPRITNPDGSLYPSARAFPDMVDAVGHGLLGTVAPRNRFTRRYRMLDWDHAGAARVDWVSGACLLARRAAWDALGGFDPRYFMYMEDVDLCWRARAAGWGVGYEPAAEVVHVQGVSAGRHPYRMLAAHHRSMWRFARSTTTGARRVLLPVVGAGLVARLGVAAVEHRAGVARRPATRSVPPGGAE